MHSIKRLLPAFLLLSASAALALPNEKPDTKTIFKPIIRTIQHKLGETLVNIKVYQYGPAKDIVMINVHSNEYTSVAAAHNWLRKNGGLLIKIENNEKRNLVFRIGRQQYEFDPNHMFSRKAIKADLEFYHNTSEKAIAETEKFAKRLLGLVPEHTSCIVALHNNFDGGFGIDDYCTNGEHESDAASVFKNPAHDCDDIFFTTDARLFKHLSSDGYNTILEDLHGVENDGSLSVYYHKKGIRYLNCETEHGKNGLYEKMITKALRHVERFDHNEHLYNYSCSDTLLHAYLEKDMPLYQDTILVGKIKSVFTSKDQKETTGKLVLLRSFKPRENCIIQVYCEDDLPVSFNICAMQGKSIGSGHAMRLLFQTAAPELMPEQKVAEQQTAEKTGN